MKSVTIDLSAHELDVILRSLDYSKLNITNSPNFHPDVSKETLKEVEDVANKLRLRRREVKEAD